MTRDCKHGRLARSCQLCEYEHEIEWLRDEIKRIRGQRDRHRRTIQSYAGEVYGALHRAERRALKEIGGE